MTLLLATFVAGLAGSPHCVGMCGAFAASTASHAAGGAAYHAGRLVTYAALGAIAGAAGAALPSAGWLLPVVAGTLTILFAASLAGLIHLPALAIPGLPRVAASFVRRGDAVGSLGLGLTTALLPCGLVYGALAAPVASGDPALGAASMVAFGLGTAPLLAAASVGVRRVIHRSAWGRRALAAFVLVTGLYHVAVRHQAALAAAEHPETGPSCH
jgi:sulfite exporter TauE/SafE